MYFKTITFFVNINKHVSWAPMRDIKRQLSGGNAKVYYESLAYNDFCIHKFVSTPLFLTKFSIHMDQYVEHN